MSRILKKTLEYLKKPKKILIYLDNKKIIKLSDKKYLETIYEIMLNKKLNLKEPKAFNEKLQWLKLYDRNPEYTKMVDKYEAKEYVSSIIDKEYISKTFGIYNNFEEINFDELPNEFVMKCTHDSGGVIICKDKASLNIKEAKKKINKSLNTNYYRLGREWPYKNVKPRIIIEELLKDVNNEDLIDYKFMCFNGRVKCSFVCLNRRSKEGLNVDFYDLQWKKMPFERHYANSAITLEKPKNYEKMIELAEKLSKNIPFVRVDFYDINGKIYFGELTFYPGSGFEEFTPDSWDYELGSWLKLEN